MLDVGPRVLGVESGLGLGLGLSLGLKAFEFRFWIEGFGFKVLG